MRCEQHYGLTLGDRLAATGGAYEFVGALVADRARLRYGYNAHSGLPCENPCLGEIEPDPRLDASTGPAEPEPRR